MARGQWAARCLEGDVREALGLAARSAQLPKVGSLWFDKRRQEDRLRALEGPVTDLVIVGWSRESPQAETRHGGHCVLHASKNT